jgi:L-threonylcarbamoyladenylate synthase
VRLLPPTDRNLRIAGECIAAGGLVALPTETVYGLGADAFNPFAVARVFEAKARPSFDPLIVHIAALSDIEGVAQALGTKARALAEKLWPGPLTLVLPKRESVPDLVTSGLPTVAVRFPDHPIARAVIAYSRTAVAAPSANPFGYLSPTRAEHVARMLGDKVDIIIDGGPCLIGLESTVLDLTQDPPRILRPGGMERAAIEAVIGPVSLDPGGAADAGPDQGADQIPGADAGAAKRSPGLLESHYAPRAPLHLVDGPFVPVGKGRKGRLGALLFDRASLERLGEGAMVFAEVRLLSPSGDLVEAAASLFALLHELDGLGLDAIWAERVPERGLGQAINDRLFKASEK